MPPVNSRTIIKSTFSTTSRFSGDESKSVGKAVTGRRFENKSRRSLAGTYRDCVSWSSPNHTQTWKKKNNGPRETLWSKWIERLTLPWTDRIARLSRSKGMEIVHHNPIILHCKIPWPKHRGPWRWIERPYDNWSNWDSAPLGCHKRIVAAPLAHFVIINYKYIWMLIRRLPNEY